MDRAKQRILVQLGVHTKALEVVDVTLPGRTQLLIDSARRHLVEVGGTLRVVIRWTQQALVDTHTPSPGTAPRFCAAGPSLLSGDPSSA